MDCVRISQQGVDFNVCTSVDDGILNGNEDYDQWQVDGSSTDSQACTAPRNVVLAGSHHPSCVGCSVGGVLEACPMTDPSFHSCLCAHRVSQKHLRCLATCFLPGLVADLSCRPSKRDATPDLDLQPPPETFTKRNVQWLQDYSGRNFFIDRYGRPNYENGAIGFPLPYWEKVIANGLGMKRCYLFPSSTRMWCIRWRLPRTVDVDYATGPVENATYGDEIDEEEEDDEVTPTKTAAPSTTEVPSVTRAPEVAEVTTAPSGTAPPTSEPEPTTEPSSANLNGLGSSLHLVAPLLAVGWIFVEFYF
ncbi:hypothetical protein HJFPF1_11049 [Paramyrothecium foliicola]|nr:hypothetical protein HJFPF1_11049 [Paramyrothecium foliicola]